MAEVPQPQAAARTARASAMSTATAASIPPSRTAAQNRGFRPTCLVMANTAASVRPPPGSSPARSPSPCPGRARSCSRARRPRRAGSRPPAGTPGCGGEAGQKHDCSSGGGTADRGAPRAALALPVQASAAAIAPVTVALGPRVEIDQVRGAVGGPADQRLDPPQVRRQRPADAAAQDHPVRVDQRGDREHRDGDLVRRARLITVRATASPAAAASNRRAGVMAPGSRLVRSGGRRARSFARLVSAGPEISVLQAGAGCGAAGRGR